MSKQLCPHGRKFCLFNDLSSKTNLLMSKCLIPFIAKSAVKIYTLRQKFSIIICVKGGKTIWLELTSVKKYFDTTVPIRRHVYGGNNQEFTESKSTVK